MLLLSLAARCRIAFGTCRHWQTYLGQLYFLSRPKAFRVRLTSAASRSNEFLPLHRDFHRNTAEVLPELIRTNSRRAATRWCTWCRRANSTRCRSTTKWSGNRTSFRLTILGQKVVSSAPSASRTRLFSPGQCVQWLTTAVRFCDRQEPAWCCLKQLRKKCCKDQAAAQMLHGTAEIKLHKLPTRS